MKTKGNDKYSLVHKRLGSQYCSICLNLRLNGLFIGDLLALSAIGFGEDFGIGLEQSRFTAQGVQRAADV